MPSDMIMDSVMYLLNFYGSAISFFLIDFNKNKKRDWKENQIIIDVTREIKLNKKLQLVEFNRLLDDKINKIKAERFYKKNNKFIFKERTIILPEINYRHNKSINKRKKNKIIKKIDNPYSSLI